MLTRSNFEKNYIENGQQDREYRVDGKTVMVKQRYHEISGAYVILSTDVIGVAAGARLFLNHPEAAMRILMVYTFLRETKISGVPDLDIAPWEP